MGELARARDEFVFLRECMCVSHSVSLTFVCVLFVCDFCVSLSHVSRRQRMGGVWWLCGTHWQYTWLAQAPVSLSMCGYVCVLRCMMYGMVWYGGALARACCVCVFV
jgi:hypothetical protein